jgi:hypothetical protein
LVRKTLLACRGVKRTWGIRGTNRSESGYALLLVMFFLALLIVSLAEVTPTLLSRIQREKEAEMVWRGEQYIRGVRMYYTKMRRFPTALDDLTTPKTGTRFMRQAYKDPMNKIDGSWRLIYVGPNGQLIGSLNKFTVGSSGTNASLGVGPSSAGFPSLPTAGGGQGLVDNQGLIGGNPSGANSLTTSAFGTNQFGAGNQAPAAGTALGNAGFDSNTNGITNNAPTNDGEQPASSASSNIIGGNIIGVGSKVNQKSFRIYDKAQNYNLFEFVWDPASGMAVGSASAGIGQPVQNTNSPGVNPAVQADSPFGSPAQNPTSIPGQGKTWQNPSSGLPDPNQPPATTNPSASPFGNP